MNKIIPDVNVFETEELNTMSILERSWGLKIVAEAGFLFNSVLLELKMLDIVQCPKMAEMSHIVLVFLVLNPSYHQLNSFRIFQVSFLFMCPCGCFLLLAPVLQSIPRQQSP